LSLWIDELEESGYSHLVSSEGEKEDDLKSFQDLFLYPFLLRAGGVKLSLVTFLIKEIKLANGAKNIRTIKLFEQNERVCSHL
jgi:hypothetical protein